MNSFKISHTFQGHSGPIYTLLFREGTALMYSGSADGLVALWDTKEGKAMPFMVKVGSPVYALLELNDYLFIGQSKGGIHVINVQSRVELRLLKYHDLGVFALIKLNRSGYFVSAGGDGKLAVIDSFDFRLLHSFKVSFMKLRCLCLSPDEQFLMVGGSDGFIRVYDTSYFNELESIHAHAGGVYAIQKLTNGRFVTGGRDAHLRFWEWKDNAFIQFDSIPAHNYAIYALSVGEAGIFASASRDKTVKIWEPGSLNTPVRLFRKGNKGHTHSVNTCAFSPNGEILATAGDDRTIILWARSTQGHDGQATS